MRVHVHHLLEGASAAQGLTVIVDVFRAFTTACYAAEQTLAAQFLVECSDVAARLATAAPRPFLIGKPEKDAALVYHCPNSPTILGSHSLAGRTVIHRSAAGAAGILRSTSATEVLAAALVNADAVARYVRARSPEAVTLVCMGHEGTAPSPEDDLCVRYLQARLQDRPYEVAPHLPALREGPGRYFFGPAQHEYPLEDFARCTETRRFGFVLRALLRGDHARVLRVDA